MHLSSFTHRGLIQSLLKPHEGSSKVWQKSQSRPRLFPRTHALQLQVSTSTFVLIPNFNILSGGIFMRSTAFPANGDEEMLRKNFCQIGFVRKIVFSGGSPSLSKPISRSEQTDQPNINICSVINELHL